MKKTIYTLMIILLLCTTFANAQLIVGSSSLKIQSGTIFSTQGLVFTPSADLTITSNTVSFSGTAITNGSDQSIDRVYSFASPLSSYSGSLGIQYSAGELNGNTESDLQLAYNPLSSGGSFVVTSESTTGSPGSYYVSNTLNSKNLGKVTALPSVTSADAGGDKTICESATSYTLVDASATEYDAVTWTTAGSGTWNGTENTEQATYYPSQADKDDVSGFVALTISANKIGSATPTTDNMNLYFYDPFTTGSIKGNSPMVFYPFNSDLDYSVISPNINEATINGDNLYSFDNGSNGYGTILETYPACGATDYASAVSEDSYFTLTLNAIDLMDLDSLVFEVGKGGSADPRGYFIRSSVDSYASDLISETLPSGPNQPPARKAIALGAAYDGISTVTFRFYIFTPDCEGYSVDWRNLAVEYGNDEGETICSGGDPALISSVDAAAGGDEDFTYKWQSSTDEAFTSPTDIPSSNLLSYDPPSGLTTTTWYRRLAHDGSCSPDFAPSDGIWKVSIQELPEADAGANATICEDETHTLDATLANYSSISWTSAGDGTFNDNTIEDPVYTPGENDITIGEAILTVTLGYIDPCGEPGKGQVTNTDNMSLTINKTPTANAGADQDVCGFTTTLAGIAANANSTAWSILSGAGGTITNPGSLTSTFSGNFGVTYTLQLEASNPGCTSETDEVQITFYDNPTLAAAGTDATICSGDNLAANEANGFNETGTWSVVAGTGGSFGDENSPTSTFSGTTGDTYTLRWTISNGACPVSSDDVVITVYDEPTADAGEDDTVCSDTYNLDGSGSGNYEDVQWSIVSGDGNGYFDGTPGTLTSGELNPTFTGTRGTSYTLRITASANCTAYDPATDDVSIFFQEAPTAYAGGDATGCTDTPYYLEDATASNYESVSWTTTGDGSFDDHTKVKATYTPAATDYPSVTLMLTAEPKDPCTTETEDSMKLSLGRAPEVDAGENASICESGYQLDGSYVSGQGSLWTTFGDGTFSNPNVLDPYYTPGTADLAAGQVKLSLVVSPVSPCTTLHNDDIFLYITQDLPTVYAGADATSCEDTPYNIEDADADDFSSLLWIRLDADGTFDDNTTLNPEYTFGPGDKVNGYAILKLVASPVSPCLLLVEDQITITVQDQATVGAGTDATICEGDTYQLIYASASNYDDLSWYTTLGSGTFSNENLLYPTYTPSSADILAGSVELCLLVEPVSPCEPSINDCMTLTINPQPEIESASLQIAYQSQTPNWSAVSGSFAAGYDLCIDGDAASNYILDIDALTSNNPLATEVYNEFYINPTDVPTGFYAYWNEKGVNIGTIGSGTWQEAMWYIISGTNPVFYLLLDFPDKAPPEDYRLIDGFQKQYNSVDVPMIIPGDYPQGDYTFSGTIEDVSGCESDEFDVDMSITHAPYADAGSNATICEDDSYTVDDAEAENYSSVTWTADACPGKGSDADGTFSGETTLTPTYTPGEGDIERGFVCLKLTAEPNSPCTVSGEDWMTLTIQTLPFADAGADDTVCEDEDYLLSDADASDYSTVSWTGGAGSFENDGIVNATYTPAESETGTTVTLTLTAEPVDPCTTNDEDSMDLYIQPKPSANAGSDATICEDGSYTVDDAEADNYSSVTWAADPCIGKGTGADGSFTGETTLTPTYTPGENDIENGFVCLVLTAEPINPCSVSDEDWMEITIQAKPVVDAGSDETICEDGSYTITDASASNHDGLTWSAGTCDTKIAEVGDGEFTSTTTLETTYTPGEGDIEAGVVCLTLTANPIDPCTTAAEDFLTLTIQAKPTANAGADQNVCGGTTFLSGQAENYTTTAWSIVSGAGGSINDPGSLTSSFSGSLGVAYELKLVADNDYCDPVSSTVTITFYDNPTPAAAGADQSICSGDNLAANPASGFNETGTWSEVAGDGNGVFGDANSSTSTFSGTEGVTYTLRWTISNDVCPVSTDDVDITIYEGPEADAGDDATICEDSDYTLSDASASGEYSSVSWTTSGDGTFTNGDQVNATYNPGSSDITNGSVTLTLALTPTCTDLKGAGDDVTDDMVLTIQVNPTADAGSNATICVDGSYTVDDASPENYSSVSWTHNGNGTIDDGNTVTPTYNAATGETGPVTLTIQVEAKDPCTTGDTDDMVITIQAKPTADAGPNGTICEDDSFDITGADATNHDGVVWSAAACLDSPPEGPGDGAFTSTTTLETNYTPGENDIEAGMVCLTLTASPIDPCTTSAEDVMTLYIQKNPTADAGSDATICEDDTYTVDDATAENYSAVTWTHNGTGTIDDVATLEPTYNAGTGETGEVTVTLHAEAKDPCTTEATDDMMITIQAKPTADAGADDAICTYDTFTVGSDASSSNDDGVNWTHNGTGSLENETTLTPTYTPGEGETGDVTLTLEAYAIDPCTVSAEDDMILTLRPRPELTSVSLQYGVAPNWDDMSVTGDLDNGYQLCLDGAEGTHYLLDVDQLVSTVDLEPDHMNPFYHTETVPDDFFDYWAARGVDENASGDWKAIMWDIINGDAPIFYLVATSPDKAGYDYQLIDGLQYQNTPSGEVPLTIPGNYPQGDYTFSGTIQDENGCMSEEMTMDMEFVHAAVAYAGEDATTTLDAPYTIEDAEAANYASISWATSGSGTFDDHTQQNPEYTPGPTDAGQVTLTMYVDAVSPCTLQASDEMILTVKVRPVVEITVPDDEAITYQYNTTIEGTASDADNNVILVEVRLNDGSWQTATGTDTWSYDATLTEGLNKVEARAKDNDGYYSDIDEISVYVHLHVVPVQATSYQMISTFLDPVDPDVIPIMGDVVDGLSGEEWMIMIDLQNIYAPAPFNINTIGNWDVESAYALFMYDLPVATEIVIAGDPLEDNSLDINDNFYYLPVLSDQNSPIADIFTDPTVDVRTIFDPNTGMVYWPDGGLNFLTELVPSRGYQLSLKDDANYPVTVDFPDYQGYKVVDQPYQLLEALCPWPLTRTNDAHIISIDAKALQDLNNADYIGAFDDEGTCIGFADLSIDNSHIPMVVFGDNTWTEIKDGATAGEQINFTAYDSYSGTEVALTAEYDPAMPNHDGNFAVKGLSLITNFYKSSTGIADASLSSSVSIFPNPARDVVNIEIGHSFKNVVVELMSAQGGTVKAIGVEQNVTQISLTDLVPGVYFVKVTSESQGQVIQKLVIQ